MRLKTESETGARKSLTPRFTDFFIDFEKKTDCFAVFSGPGCSFYECYEWYTFLQNTRVYIIKDVNFGTRLGVRLIEGVRSIGGPLNRVFALLVRVSICGDLNDQQKNLYTFYVHLKLK